MGGLTGVSHAVNGVSTLTSACGAGGSVVAHGLIAGALGGGGGILLAIGIESAFIWYQCYKKRISWQEAAALTGISLASSAAAGIGFFGVMAIGAAVGTPGGPIGFVVGASIAAVIAGIIFFK